MFTDYLEKKISFEILKKQIEKKKSEKEIEKTKKKEEKIKEEKTKKEEEKTKKEEKKAKKGKSSESEQKSPKPEQQSLEPEQQSSETEQKSSETDESMYTELLDTSRDDLKLEDKLSKFLTKLLNIYFQYKSQKKISFGNVKSCAQSFGSLVIYFFKLGFLYKTAKALAGFATFFLPKKFKQEFIDQFVSDFKSELDGFDLLSSFEKVYMEVLKSDLFEFFNIIIDSPAFISLYENSNGNDKYIQQFFKLLYEEAIKRNIPYAKDILLSLPYYWIPSQFYDEIVQFLINQPNPNIYHNPKAARDLLLRDERFREGYWRTYRENLCFRGKLDDIPDSKKFKNNQISCNQLIVKLATEEAQKKWDSLSDTEREKKREEGRQNRKERKEEKKNFKEKEKKSTENTESTDGSGDKKRKKKAKG
jgi:hypothetical protein